MRHGRLKVPSSACTGVAMQAIDLNFNLASWLKTERDR
jgi:hypothetical protein